MESRFARRRGVIRKRLVETGLDGLLVSNLINIRYLSGFTGSAGSLIVLAGLGAVFGEAGQVIAEGTPLGLMGGAAATGGELLSTRGEGAGTDRSESLYIEVRQDNRPVDPLTWFAIGPEG